MDNRLFVLRSKSVRGRLSGRAVRFVCAVSRTVMSPVNATLAQGVGARRTPGKRGPSTVRRLLLQKYVAVDLEIKIQCRNLQCHDGGQALVALEFAGGQRRIDLFLDFPL